MDSNTQNLIVAVLLGGLALHAQTFELAPAEGARFALEVYKTKLMAGKKHVFVFERYSGEATVDEVRFVVEAGSVNCTDTWVNEGSRKKIESAARDEVLQANRFPQLVFASSKVVAKGADQYDVRGTLSIHGVPKPVTVQVTRKPDAFEGEATVKLSDYGIKPPSGPTFGLIGTKDEMKVLFRLIPKPR